MCVLKNKNHFNLFYNYVDLNCEVNYSLSSGACRLAFLKGGSHE
nr:MAG TPA_asm: hypothetical protein [Caudoviricetes sp.]